jgi:hypothetical protein
MSNSLAIATVTASLQNLLQSAFNTSQPDRLDGSIVSAVPLGDPKLTTRGANIFLYQVSENQALRNAVLPARNDAGGTVKAPQVALDLHYLLSFYGTEGAWEPQRFLGITMRTFSAVPTLTRQIISQTLQTVGAPGGNLEFLNLSDLADGPQLVRLTPTTISLEELSKLWSVLLQQKYVLSILYVASVVLIDSTESGVAALPVLHNQVSVNVMRSLAITQVVTTDATTFGAIVSGARVAVLGHGLTTPGLLASVDGVALAVPFLAQSESRLEFLLPNTLRAGAHALRLSSFLGTSALPTNESNLVTFSLRPTIAGPISKTVSVASPPTSPPSLFDGTLTVPVSPRVSARQRRSLLLSRKDASSGSRSTGAVLSLRPALPDDTSDTNVLTFSFASLPAGTYAARLRVDDAESPPILPLASPPSGTLGPEVVIP